MSFLEYLWCFETIIKYGKFLCVRRAGVPRKNSDEGGEGYSWMSGAKKKIKMSVTSKSLEEILEGESNLRRNYGYDSAYDSVNLNQL